MLVLGKPKLNPSGTHFAGTLLAVSHLLVGLGQIDAGKDTIHLLALGMTQKIANLRSEAWKTRKAV